MAGGFGQYLRETRVELRHVAWPTRAQTIIYALLVALISIGIALYLGFFDFLFTAGLKRFLSVVPQSTPTTATTSPITITPTATGTLPSVTPIKIK